MGGRRFDVFQVKDQATQRLFNELLDELRRMEGRAQAAEDRLTVLEAGGAVAAHATTHYSAGSDAVDVKQLAGYPGGTATFLRADATFAAPGGATVASGTATLDFGATPTDEASVVVADAGVAAGSEIAAWFMRTSTADNGVDEHEEAASLCPLNCGSIVAGVSFTVRAHTLAMLGVGQFTIAWERI